MYSVVKRTILFEEHSPRVLVPRVEFISARGDPAALLTGKALFSWQKDKRRFRWKACTSPAISAPDRVRLRCPQKYL